MSGQPIGDAEGAVFGEAAVVEDQDEVRFLAADVQDGMAVAAREVPNVARIEVVGFRLAVRPDDRGADAALDDKGPLGGVGVPVQFAEAARFQTH